MRTQHFILFITILISMLLCVPTRAQNSSSQFIVKFNQRSSLDYTVLARFFGNNFIIKRELADYSLVIEVEKQFSTLQQLNADPNIEYAIENEILSANMEPNDDNIHWGYGDSPIGINLLDAWTVTSGSPDVTVAVIDTGISYHEDLKDNILPGYSFIKNNTDTEDNGPNTFYHGTHIAGIIAANGHIKGVAPKTKILPLQVLDERGKGYIADVIDGIYWAMGVAVPNTPLNNHPAKIINISLNNNGPCNAAWKKIINRANELKVTLVVAAGNDGIDARFKHPANCADVITVAATNHLGHRSYYSNFGDVVTIAAPGGEFNRDTGDISHAIFSTIKNDYAFYQGTSMASPHVAGVIALLYAINPELSVYDVKTILTTTASVISGEDDAHYGLINAAAAVRHTLAY